MLQLAMTLKDGVKKNKNDISFIQKRIDLLIKRQYRSEKCIKQIVDDTSAIRTLMNDVASAGHLAKQLLYGIKVFLKYAVFPMALLVAVGYWLAASDFPDWFKAFREFIK